MVTASTDPMAKADDLPRRIAAFAAAALAAGVAFSQALATQPGGRLEQLSLPVFRNPAFALTRIPTGAAQGKPFELRDPAGAARLAKQALATSPLEPSAILILAFADGSAKREEALRKGYLAERLSRRHAGVQLWLLQTRLSNGPVRPALVHIDRLLKVNPEMAAQVFPVFAQGLKDRTLRSVLAGEIASRANWGGDFIFYAGSEPALAEDLAQLLLEAKQVSDSKPARDGIAAALKHLADQGKPDLLVPLAKRYGAAVGAGADSGFAQVEGAPPFAWELAVDAEFGADVRQAGPQSVDLSGWINPERSGTGARKLVWVTPGRWRLSWKDLGLTGDAASRASWRIRCLTQSGYGEPVASPNLFAASQHKFFAFSLPDRCRVAMFELALNGSATNDVTEVNFTELKLSKVGGAAGAAPFTKGLSVANAARDNGNEQ